MNVMSRVTGGTVTLNQFELIALDLQGKAWNYSIAQFYFYGLNIYSPNVAYLTVEETWKYHSSSRESSFFETLRYRVSDAVRVDLKTRMKQERPDKAA